MYFNALQKNNHYMIINRTATESILQGEYKKLYKNLSKPKPFGQETFSKKLGTKYGTKWEVLLLRKETDGETSVLIE